MKKDRKSIRKVVCRKCGTKQGVCFTECVQCGTTLPITYYSSVKLSEKES
ncbi:MAG: hypothetical protein ACW97X_10755 [Candidatus Hodarchaeales archaeon]